MSTTDQEAIASLEARMYAVEKRTTRNETAIDKLNEAITVLREAVAKVATKDDILALSQNIDAKFDKQLTDARNSIPGKVAIVFSAGMFLLAFAGFISSHLGR